MPNPIKRKHSPSLRLKIVVVSLLSFLITTACSWLRLRPGSAPGILWHKLIAPTETPMVLCYEVVAPTDTPTSPASPLPTPTPTSAPETRRFLLEQLLAEGRFPLGVVWQLTEGAEG